MVEFDDYSLKTPPDLSKIMSRSQQCTCCSQLSHIPSHYHNYPLTPSSTLLPGSGLYTPCSKHVKTSTPLNDSAIFVTPDIGTNKKIEELEVELSKLREQLASIVLNQEHIKSTGKQYVMSK